jgi:RHS repeat-associated protein
MPGLKGKYDAWNRLIEVRDSNDNLIAQYEYNGLNQRIKKTVGSTVTKSFFNENWQEVESVTNNQVTSYVWGLRYIDDLVLREKGEERLYSLADPNWNVIAICDVDGDIQERYAYDAFGKRNIFDASFTAKIGTEFNWNRAFTGQLLDAETGLMLYRNRYYHTELGRFVNRDPIKYGGKDNNLYRYVFNKIIIATDSTGLFSLCSITNNPCISNALTCFCSIVGAVDILSNIIAVVNSGIGSLIQTITGTIDCVCDIIQTFESPCAGAGATGGGILGTLWSIGANGLSCVNNLLGIFDVYGDFQNIFQTIADSITYFFEETGTAYNTGNSAMDACINSFRCCMP